MTTPSKADVLRMVRKCGFDPHDMSDDFTVNLENIERFAAAMYAAGADGCNTQAAVAMYLAGAEDSGAWKRLVLDHLVVCNILSAEHENNPEKALTDLINWHMRVALDPLVSSDAAALVAKGAEDMRERAKSVCSQLEFDYLERRVFPEECDITQAAAACGSCTNLIAALPITLDTSLLHDKCHVDIANARPAKSAKAITPANTEGKQQ